MNLGLYPVGDPALGKVKEFDIFAWEAKAYQICSYVTRCQSKSILKSIVFETPVQVADSSSHLCGISVNFTKGRNFTELQLIFTRLQHQLFLFFYSKHRVTRVVDGSPLQNFSAENQHQQRRKKEIILGHTVDAL